MKNRLDVQLFQGRCDHDPSYWSAYRAAAGCY
jgi:hypothetical protein